MSTKTCGLTDEFDVLVSTNALIVFPFRSVTGTKGSFLLILISSSEWVGRETAAEVWPLISAALSFPTVHNFHEVLSAHTSGLMGVHVVEAAAHFPQEACFLQDVGPFQNDHHL